MALRRNKDERIFFPFFSDILHISVAHCHIQIIAALARSVQKENQRIFLVFIKVFGQVLNISKIEIRIRLPLFFVYIFIRSCNLYPKYFKTHSFPNRQLSLLLFHMTVTHLISLGISTFDLSSPFLYFK